MFARKLLRDSLWAFLGLETARLKCPPLAVAGCGGGSDCPDQTVQTRLCQGHNLWVGARSREAGTTICDSPNTEVGEDLGSSGLMEQLAYQQLANQKDSNGFRILGEQGVSPTAVGGGVLTKSVLEVPLAGSASGWKCIWLEVSGSLSLIRIFPSPAHLTGLKIWPASVIWPQVVFANRPKL